MLTNQDKTPILLRENRPGTLIQWPKDSSPVFEESQKLDRAWLWLLVFEFILLGIIFTISEVPWMAIIVIGFISSLAIILLRRMELKVKMDPKGIHLIMNMIFSKEEKTLPWSSIASIQVRKLTGFMERSGYGKKPMAIKSFIT